MCRFQCPVLSILYEDYLANNLSVVEVVIFPQNLPYKNNWKTVFKNAKPGFHIAELDLRDGAAGEAADRSFLREERRIGHMI